MGHIAGMSLTVGQPPALQLLRMTTAFVPQEDRLRLEGEVAGGGVVVLWLTQRLLNRLVPHLCAWLQRPRPASEAVLAGRLVPDGDHLALPNILPVGKSSAAMQVQADEPLQNWCCPRNWGSWLVTEVDIVQTEQVLVLSFRAPERPAAGIELQPQPLRQWLEILLRYCLVAEWTLQVWPSWMLVPCDAAAGLH